MACLVLCVVSQYLYGIICLWFPAWSFFAEWIAQSPYNDSEKLYKVVMSYSINTPGQARALPGHQTSLPHHQLLE